jgi:hypothetical protein
MKSKKSAIRIQVILLAIAFPLLLNSFTMPPLSQQNEASNYKKECMLEVLESLEAGEQYIKEKSWGESKYLSIDIPQINIPGFDDFEFEIDFPEIAFEEFDIEEFEARISEFEERIEEKMESLIKKIEEIHLRYEKR